MNFARIKFHNHPLVGKIDPNVEHARNLRQHRIQFAHACITIFAFGGDFDRLDNRMIGSFAVERVVRFNVVWSRRIHQLWNAGRRFAGRRNFSRDRFQDAPHIVGQNFLTGRVRMNMIGLI